MPASKISTKKTDLRWPREHFSWSQYHTFRDQGPMEFAKKYIYGENPTNPAMELGKTVAEMIEHDNEQEDVTLEHLRTFLPRYEHHEFKIEVPFNGIILQGFLDGFDESTKRIGEYKTGRRWTQEMADSTEQLHWYALLVHLKYGIPPEKIAMTLHWMPTEWNNGDPILSGEIENFATKRTLRDCLDVGKRIVDTWRKIGEFCAKEYESLGM